MHAVGVLVVLCAQCVDQAARRVQLPAELLQLGTVAQGDHGTAVAGGHPIGDQDPLAAHGQQVGAGHAAGQHVGRASRPECSLGGVADGLAADVQQPLRLVVQQPHPAAAVQGDHALPDAVQHGVALREQPRDVREGQVTGLPLHPARDEPGRQGADGQRTAGVREQPGNGVDQPCPDAVVGDAHRDRPDDLAVCVAQRHLAAGGAAQGAVVDLHDLLPGQCLTGVGRDDLTDPPRVGVRPAHALPVQHDDVLRLRGPADPLRLRLHRAVRRRSGGAQVTRHLRLLRRRLRDRQRPAHRLVVQLVAERGEEQPGREHRDSRGDRQLHQQHLGEHPPRQAQTPAADGGSGAHTHDGTWVTGAFRRGV